MGISTHILDLALGLPASGVNVALSRQEESAWVSLHQELTDADGRVSHLLRADQALTAGMYRVRFETASYYSAQNMTGLYPFVEITFIVEDVSRHWHIPLLLTANGYTTYRGS